MRNRRRRGLLSGTAAAGLAVAYIAAAVWFPTALAGVTVAAVAAACALVLQGRTSRGLRRLLAALTAWLAIGFAGAIWLAGRPEGGLFWVLLFLFLAPLPLIPWGYSATFPRDESDS